MPITDWPADERPREKLLKQGVQALSDAELLAIFLRVGIPGVTAVDLARNMLTEFDGLRPLLRASPGQFCRIKGMGTAKYAQLQAALELGRRHLECSIEHSQALSNPADTCHYLRSCIGHLPHEVFACLFLDTRHRVICFETLFNGTIDSTSVHPREVVRRALHHNAAAVIFAHNHPSGVAEPSGADQAITRRLSEALQLIDVRVLDHLVVGASHCTSMAELGLL
ncbi:MAG: DNA repair protein RadC [gamma proteobacterium symbiont of Bathyaustriella thionipta]|nr:DNA repair protein RadC [gamma proteobacterium symbiont of Bathyaustriella thionipta]